MALLSPSAPQIAECILQPPKRFLQAQETLTSRIEGIGTLTTTFRR